MQMKKSILVTLVALFCLSSLSAQNSFMGLFGEYAERVGLNLEDSRDKAEFIKYCKTLLQQCRVVDEQDNSTAYSLRNNARRTTAHSSFTERVRIPDVCVASLHKYYRIRNVKTGEYLQFGGVKAPLTTVAVPDQTCTFYFINDGLGGNDMSFCSNECTGKYFYGPKYNKWSFESGWFANFNNPRFFFNPLADGSGFYISNKEADNILDDESDDLGEIWRYDPKEKVVVIGELDEYAVWEIEPIAVVPQLSTESDTIWYVLRNVDNGGYLHYEGNDASMTTVFAPDTCSLFFGVQQENGQVLFHNYSAGSLACGGTDKWTEEGAFFNILPAPSYGNNRFFISQSGDGAGSDIWRCDEEGVVGLGGLDNSAVWEFERIANFKEIFGFANNGDGGKALNYLLPKLEELLTADEISLNQGIASIYSILVVMLYGGGSYMEMSKIEEMMALENAIGDKFETFVDRNTLKDIRLYNSDHLVIDETTGTAFAKGLATNSGSLVVNDIVASLNANDATVMQVVDAADHVHTNMWQFRVEGTAKLLNGEEEDVRLLVYNTTTQMYIAEPKLGEDGTYVVGMTSDKANAGRFIFGDVLGDLKFDGELNGIDDFDKLLMGGYFGSVTLQFVIDGRTCLLYLASPDDQMISCMETEEPDAVTGAKWTFVSGTSAVDEDVYNHATDASRTYPEVLQEKYGLVKGGGFYSTNYPSVDYSTDNLLDCNRSTVFWTEHAEEDEHYLQADLGEGGEVSSFYFYMRPNFSACYNVPVRITVEGSNNENEGFVVLSEEVMPDFLYNMYYFSSCIGDVDGPEYRYLRFTVNEVNTDGDRRFTLSEFYIYPNNEIIAQAKGELDGFYEEEYMGTEVVIPSAILMKRKAEILLEKHKNNHAETPKYGQYPTWAYNALDEAYKTVDVTDEVSVRELSDAINAFIASLSQPFLLPMICIVESAWEDGYFDGCAFTSDLGTGVTLQEKNPWDIRQWCKVYASDTEENPYVLEAFIVGNLHEDASLPVNISKIPDWNEAYGSQREAFNIYHKQNSHGLYFSASKENPKDCVVYGKEYPATKDENRNAAWYITYMADASNVSYVKNMAIVEPLAAFGQVMALAEYFYNGEQGGQFVYNGANGVSKEEFDELYFVLKEYYDLGPVKVLSMYNSGLIADADVEGLVGFLEYLYSCFPNFVFGNSYFRLRGNASGNLIVAEANGVTTMAAEYATNGTLDKDVELKSIFYLSPNSAVDKVNVMSYENGRYMAVDNGVLKYNLIPQDGQIYAHQGVCYDLDEGTVEFDGNNYLVDNETSVGISDKDTGEARCRWTIEPVNELPVVISAAKFATFYAPVELQIPAGITAYVLYDESRAEINDYNIATGREIEEGANVFNVKAIEGGVLAAGLPVILQAEKAGTYYFKINYAPTLVTDEDKRETYSTDDEEVNNLLEGCHATTYIPERSGYTHYILANKEQGVGMYKVTTYDALTSKDGVTTTFDTYSFQNNAHRAWLPMLDVDSQRAPGYVFSIGRGEGATTDVEDIELEKNDKVVIYDLLGRRLEKIIYPGIYIVNGERVLVK